MGRTQANRNFLVADFETSTAKWLDTDSVARVWLWGLYDIESDEFIYGENLSDFMGLTLTMWKRVRKNPIIYFHNLKFDGSYIVNYLLTNGYIYDDELTGENTFRTCITDMGLWHFVEVCVYYHVSKKGKVSRKILRYQDSLKKMPMPVSEIPSTFKFEDDMVKGEIDYDLYRPIGHKATEEEKSYLFRDCVIVARGLKTLETEGFNKMTTASDAYAKWKESIQSIKAREKKIPPNVTFRQLYPELSLEVDDYLRRAYRGGWTYTNPLYQNQIINDMEVYDINSMYPSKMKNKYLPIGDPIPFKGKPRPNKYQCYVVRVLISFDIKPDHLPCIQLKHSYMFNPTEYITSSNNCEAELCITNVDLNLIFKQYNVHTIEYLDGYYFRKCKGMFDKFIDENMKIKETSVGGKRYLAKARMNSCYGKTATSPRKQKKIPYLDDDGILRFTLSEEEIGETEYIPLGIFITSYARRDIIMDAQNNYDRFVYCDTDSLHLKKKANGDAPDLPIHPSKLGYYKKEKDVKKALFLRSKTYIEEGYDGVIDIKCAGAPEKVKEGMTFENFKLNASYSGKLVPAQVKGGCILKDSIFTIR